MCGQYSFKYEPEELLDRYPGMTIHPRSSKEEKAISYPGQENLILLPNHIFYDVKWGFIPSFSKRPLINARLETILEKKTFAIPFKQKRCIIPATFFYEFEEVEGKKHKECWQISVSNSMYFSMAGVCERYMLDDGSSILTYSILTKESVGKMADIHHRVPVILTKEMEGEYLDLKNDPKELQNKLAKLSVDLTFMKVS